MSVLRVYDTGRVQRFHAEPDYSGTPRQNLAEHCWGVAVLVREIYLHLGIEEPPARVLLAALLHDAEESVLGDVPAPAKWRFPKLRDAYKEAEEEVATELGLSGIAKRLSVEEQWILKWADSLELLAYCKRKLLSGNTAYGEPFDNILNAMNDYPAYRECIKVRDQILKEEK